MIGSVLLTGKPRIAFAVLALALVGLASSEARAQVFSADAVKATFIHRFAFYVEWPEGAIPDSTFTIGVVENEPIARQLEALLSDVRIHERRVAIRRITRPDEASSVQILYIGPSKSSVALRAREAALAGHVLLVTESPDGLANGAVINFLPTTRNVRFEISLSGAQRMGLTINSQLLSVAARVEGRAQTLSPCAEQDGTSISADGCRLRVARLMYVNLPSKPLPRF